MELASQLSFVLPYAVSIGLIVVFFILFYQKKNYTKFLVGSLIAIFVTKIVSVGLQSLFYYFSLKQDVLGKVLLQQDNNFYWNQVKESAQVLAVNFGIALIVLIILFMILRWQKKPWISETTPLVISFLIISLGNINFIVAILSGLIFSLVYLVYKALFKKKYDRVIIDPFVLVAGLIILIITWFPFYTKILSFLRIV